jgi:hypothetical protein
VKVCGVITLTTDFGLSDPYVGIMRGVILSINPEARLIDISHQIRAGDILHAGSLIQEAYHFFPKGTVHVGVVDPGVGTNRRPIAIEIDSHVFVGPDNGLFWPIITNHEDTKIIHLTERNYFLPQVSRTFHGRDIFAPVAAHLSLGLDMLEMGRTISDPTPLRLPTPQQKGDILYGQVIREDHFGNLITNIYRKDLERFLGQNRPIIRIENFIIEGVSNTYSEAAVGEALALIGSSNLLEIAVNLGRARDHVRVSSENIIGMVVEVSKG